MPIFPLFDTYVMVDWSAKATPSDWPPGEDSIWWAAVQARGKNRTRVPPAETIVAHERTRHSAISHLSGFLAEELAESRRVLVGFDFAFGYPSGFSKIVTGRASAESVWRWLSDRILDEDGNRNNRFSVAGELNETIRRKTGEVGPFWVVRRKMDDPFDPRVPNGNPYKKDALPWPADFGFAHRRVTDYAPGAQPVWKLFGPGTVGSQALLGLPALGRLRAGPALKDRSVAWPFQTGWSLPDATGRDSVVIVEIYPSLLKRSIDEFAQPGEVRDRTQVRLNALAFSLLGENEGGLDRLFLGPRDEDLRRAESQWPQGGSADERMKRMRDRIEKEEGWMFGFGYQAELERALEEALRRNSEDVDE